jgi:hypothetical protein
MDDGLARRVMTQSSGLVVIVIGTVLMREEFTFIIFISCRSANYHHLGRVGGGQ